MRTLASVQRVTAISPIEGADAIEAASVLGWKVVVKKGEYEPGDLAVYLEIDSVPPDVKPFQFLWAKYEQRPGNYRIKTVKLRGQISQGLLVQPYQIEDFLPQDDYHNFGRWLVEGHDLTEALGVTKYESPLPKGATDIEGQFFDGVPKTDEERVQSETGQRLLAAIQGRPYYITVKCDGASMTVAQHGGEVKVASRNYRLARSSDSPYWHAASKGLLQFVEQHPNLALQGELVGPGIQNNRLGLKDHHCYVFNIYDRDLGVRMSWPEMVEHADGRFELVPLVQGPTRYFSYTQDELLRLAEGKYDGTSNEREGIVIRAADPYENISFKAISNRFLLKGGD